MATVCISTSKLGVGASTTRTNMSKVLCQLWVIAAPTKAGLVTMHCAHIFPELSNSFVYLLRITLLLALVLALPLATTRRH